MFDPRCNVCSAKSVRDLVDPLLARGVRPAEIWNTYGDALQTSRAGLYRHSSHYTRPVGGVAWLGDYPVGEAIADQAALVRRNIEQYAAAIERGDNASAARYSHEAQSGMGVLLKLGFDTEEMALGFDLWQGVYRVCMAYAIANPDAREPLAELATTYGQHGLADDFRNPGEITD